MRLTFTNPTAGQKILEKSLNRQSTVDEMRKLAYQRFSIDQDSFALRLIGRGKELADGCTLFEYGIQENDIIFVNPKQITSKVQNTEIPDEQSHSTSPKHPDDREQSIDGESMNTGDDDLPNEIPAESQHYKIGDKVDVQCSETGAWFEATVDKITLKIDPDGNEHKLLFHCIYESFGLSKETVDSLDRLAPRAYRRVKFDDIDVGHNLLVNYNVDAPHEIGEWYRAEVKYKSVESRRKQRYLICDLFLGADKDALLNCKVVNIDEFYKYEETTLLENRPEPDLTIQYKLRKTRQCIYCHDKSGKKCRYCKCVVCESGTNDDRMLLCEECQEAYHIFCLQPPLDTIPEDDWFCPECKIDDSAIVKAGEKARKTKRLLNMPSQKNNAKRNWDSGNQCKGLTKRCTKVGADFFGPIPGVEVGTTWQFQTQLAEAGVHRMVVAGIHGSASKGAFSIIVSGGYEDDKDDGDEILYTGSGGRDLSGNKRTASQSSDQKFERCNKGLAMNCKCKLDSNGGDAREKWRQGKPVRVCRSYKAKDSQYKPTAGYRYDGVYKVVKFWREKGRGGHYVYRYLLRRDDPVPPPWSKEGKKRMKRLGLDRVIMKDADVRASIVSSGSTDGADGEPPAKKINYKIEKKLLELIEADAVNEAKWHECLEKCTGGHRMFVDAVEEAFTCLICHALMKNPVTVDCGHSFCKKCLENMFSTVNFFCPACRYDLGKGYSVELNEELNKVLNTIFVGYNSEYVNNDEC